MNQANPAKPPEQRPELPDFWDKRFQSGITPWDAGKVPAALAAFARQQPPRRTLIPGCGSAWEATFLDRLGWPVTALDFSPVAVAAAKEVLGDWNGRLVCEDFFAHVPEAPLDLIYERAFLCALPRKMWAAWAEQMARLLPHNAFLAGFFFFSEDLKGPPFGISPDALDALLAPAFEKLEDEPVSDSIPIFAGKERWQVWRRR